MAKAPIPSRGEIWLIDFDPAVGAEIRKLRPAVVMSVDAIGRLPLRLVVPITDWKDSYSQYPWFPDDLPMFTDCDHHWISYGVPARRSNCRRAA